MRHQVNVYYMYCPKADRSEAKYLSYQRKLADEILNHGLKEMFNIDGNGKKVKKGRYGKPYFAGMEQYHYNISNTDGMVVCAIGDIEIGVDAERIKNRKYSDGLLKKCCIEEEIEYIGTAENMEEQTERFLQIWTLKESYIKLMGQGLRMPLKEVSFQTKVQGEVRCSKAGSFCQKRVGEYWIALGTTEEAQTRWNLLETYDFLRDERIP